MAVIDTATNKVKTWIPLPAVGYGSAVTLDGRWLLVQMGPAKQVMTDLGTMKVARTIDVGSGAGEIFDARMARSPMSRVPAMAKLRRSI